MKRNTIVHLGLNRDSQTKRFVSIVVDIVISIPIAYLSLWQLFRYSSQVD